VLLFNSGSPMMLDQTEIVHGVFDIIEGSTPPASGPSMAARIDTVLAVLTLAALALGGCGVVRAGRWARRRRSTPLAAALSLLPPALVLGAGAAFPWLAEAWIGRDVTWRAAAYEWPAVFVFVAAAVVASVSTLLARSRQWSRTPNVVHTPTAPQSAPATQPAAQQLGQPIPATLTRRHP